MINSIGMEFVAITSGSFLMGSPSDELGRMPDEEEHNVNLTDNFSMQITTVTVDQWRIFSQETGYRTENERHGGSWCHHNRGWKLPPSRPFFEWSQQTEGYWDQPGFPQTGDHPVTCVSWNDAQQFILWLSEKENANYRLPTEAEWEYSCRAGTATAYSFGSQITLKNAIYCHDRLTNFIRNISPVRTLPAKSFEANQWGLYNMHGNVWEWCHDHCDGQDFLVINDTYRNDIENPC